MIQKIAVLAVLVFLSISFFGQSDDVKMPSNNEFGVNVTTLVSNLFPFESSAQIAPSTSLLFYKTGDGRLYWRSGMNVDFQNSEQEFQTDREHTFMLKSGFEIKNSIGKSWVFHYGADAIAVLQGSKTKNTDPFFGDFEFSNATNAFGIDAIYGFEWMVNKKMAISTEGSLLMARSKTTSKSDAGPGFPDEVDESTSFLVDLILPNSIFLSYYF